MAALTWRDGSTSHTISLTTGRQDELGTWLRPMERQDTAASIQPIGHQAKEGSTQPAKAEGLQSAKTGTFENTSQPL